MRFNYENLDVSKLSKQTIKDIYKITENFPKTEVFGLSNQIQRAAISILLNIAEGGSKMSNKEFNRFVRISIGSLVEMDCALKIAIDLGYIQMKDYDNIEPKIKELYFKLIGLSKYLSK